MNVLLFTNGTNLVPFYTTIRACGHQVGLVLPENCFPHIRQMGNQLAAQGVVVFYADGGNWQGLAGNPLTADTDLIVTMAFPFILPGHILDMPRLGAYNVHYSLLPAYKGSDPLFWQIKNGEQVAGVSIHRMTGIVDGGEIVLQADTPIYPGETYGFLGARLNNLAVTLLGQLMEAVGNNKPGVVESAYPSSSYNRPDQNDITINWQLHSASDIEHLVNACNPNFGGAITYLNGQQIKIVEVTPAQLEQPIPAPPGAIILSDVQHGVIVCCKANEYIRINVVMINEGILSGVKWASAGLQKGAMLG